MKTRRNRRVSRSRSKIKGGSTISRCKTYKYAEFILGKKYGICIQVMSDRPQHESEELGELVSKSFLWEEKLDNGHRNISVQTRVTFHKVGIDNQVEIRKIDVKPHHQFYEI